MAEHGRVLLRLESGLKAVGSLTTSVEEWILDADSPVLVKVPGDPCGVWVDQLIVPPHAVSFAAPLRRSACIGNGQSPFSNGSSRRAEALHAEALHSEGPAAEALLAEASTW